MNERKYVITPFFRDELLVMNQALSEEVSKAIADKKYFYGPYPFDYIDALAGYYLWHSEKKSPELVKLGKEDIIVTVHALMVKGDKIKNGRGTRCGLFTIAQLDGFVEQLRKLLIFFE